MKKKNKIPKIPKIEKMSTRKMLLILVIIILFIPPFLTLPAISNFLNFSDKGQIGDTIGGITSPFINGLAAILVFLAFKEQIRANEIFKEQEKVKMILDQIALVQEDKLEMEKIIPGTIDRLNLFQHPFDAQNAQLLNKITYFITEIKLANELIEQYPGNKDFMYKKLHFLYTIRFKDLFDKLNQSFNPPFFCHADYTGYIFEIQVAIQKFNTTFIDINKFKVIR